MSSYYITARNHKKAIKIPVESKHIYFGNQDTAPGLLKMPGWANINEICYPNSVNKIWTSNEFKLAKGTNADQFIGDKIQLKSVLFQYRFQLRGSVYVPPSTTSSTVLYNNNSMYALNYSGYLAGNLTNGTGEIRDWEVSAVKNESWFRTFRLMLVHFDDDAKFDDSTNGNFERDIAYWFNSIYVPLQYSSASGTSDNGYAYKTTNQANILRESTIYNKQFKIIKDWSFTLSPKKPCHTIQFQLDPKRQLNLKENLNNEFVPTDDWFRNTYLICFSPISNHDVDPLSYQYFDTQPATSIINEVEYDNITKYTWYDI